MSAKVTQRYRLWQDKLVQAVRVAMPVDSPYTVVHCQNLVGLFTCIFVKNAEVGNLRDVAITTVKRGMAGMYGNKVSLSDEEHITEKGSDSRGFNKGAIVARLVLDDSSLCFINCHLAAGQSHKSARNAVSLSHNLIRRPSSTWFVGQDLSSILDEEPRFPVAASALDEVAYVSGGDGSLILDHDMTFLQGDLNYRIDLRRENVLSSLRAGERAYLLEHDQLLKEMKNSAFRLRTFHEAPICFE